MNSVLNRAHSRLQTFRTPVGNCGQEQWLWKLGEGAQAFSGGYSMTGENSAPAKNRSEAPKVGASSKLAEICSAGDWSKGRQPKQPQSAAAQGAGCWLSSPVVWPQQASLPCSLSNAAAVLAKPACTVRVQSRTRRVSALRKIANINIKIREPTLPCQGEGTALLLKQVCCLHSNT